MTTTVTVSVRHPLYTETVYYVRSTDTDTFNAIRGYYAFNNSRTTGPNKPSWRELIKRGDDATTYLQGERYSTIRKVPGLLELYPGPTWTSSYRYKGYDLENIPFINYDSNMAALVTLATNGAKTKHTRKLHKLTNQFQGGVFFGELTEALHQIRNPARTLRRGIGDYYETVKKRSSKNPRHKLGEIASDTWLEYVFGWAPLISDVKDGAEALARYHLKQYAVPQRVTSSFTEEKTITVPTYSTRNFGISRYRYRQKRHLTATRIYRTQVAATPFTSTEMGLHLFGFSWSEFVPTVWELIPYSFLVDYFSNIGDVLSGWSWQDYSARWSNTTLITTIDNSIADMYFDKDWIASYLASGFVSGYTFRPQAVTRRYRYVERDSYNGDFVPSLQFEIPGIGSLKWLNIGALASLKTIYR